MARQVFPITFALKVKLFGDTDAKDTADGATSIIRPYLVQQGYDMSVDRGNVATAVTNNLAFEKNFKLAEKLHELCVVKLTPIIKDHKTVVQSLKTFYSKTPHSLGDFGITVVGKRIVYPADRVELCTAIAFLINYNAGLPAGTSPLTPAFLTENKIDLAANLAALPTILDNNTKSKVASDASQTASQKRDNGIAIIVTHLRGICGFILKQFPKTPKKANEWGNVIDNSPKGSKLTTLKFPKGTNKVIYSAVAGSIVQITGAASLTFTKGVAGTGTAITLATGDTWQVPKGYTTMTVKNPSLLLIGALTYMSN